MQEEVENRTVSLAVSTARLTERTLIGGIRMYLQHRRYKKWSQGSRGVKKKYHGKMKVKDLLKSDQGTTTMEISDKKLKTFERVARKYGVDFAVTKDKTQTPARYVVFFKARDADALTQVVKEYSNRILKEEKRPSVLESLQKFKDIVKAMPRKKVRRRNREKSL